MNYSIIAWLLMFSLIGCNSQETRRTYYKSGKIESEITYRDGRKNGEAREFYENGKLKSHYQFVNDTLNGNMIEYFADQTIKAKGFFWRGRAVGPVRDYYGGKEVLYNERDWNSNVYYVKKYDTSVALIKEEGVAVSPGIFENFPGTMVPSEVAYKICLFYAAPDGYKNYIKGELNGEKIGIKLNSNHIATFDTVFTKAGNYTFKVVSSLYKEGSLFRKDSILKQINVF